MPEVMSRSGDNFSFAFQVDGQYYRAVAKYQRDKKFGFSTTRLIDMVSITEVIKAWNGFKYTYEEVT